MANPMTLIVGWQMKGMTFSTFLDSSDFSDFLDF